VPPASFFASAGAISVSSNRTPGILRRRCSAKFDRVREYSFCNVHDRCTIDCGDRSPSTSMNASANHG
jgi:hypothetical protein